MHHQYRWKRCSNNPIFPVVPDTWMESQTANPDLLDRGDHFFMYFRGQQGGHDRIGLAIQDKTNFDGKTWNIMPHPIIDVGKSGDCDENHVLDPSSIMINGIVYLYYSAVCTTCDRSICLATSKDGIHFNKFEKNPIIIGGGSEIVVKDGKFYLYYWQPARRGSGFEIHLSTSRDGLHFKKASSDPVLPVGQEGSWDSHTVETPRIFKEKNLYYMIYCGSDRHDDYPSYAGLATSSDLIHWEKYEGNPIFSRGEAGEWDEGAIWFTTVEKINDIYYMWYEGYGGATARWQPYGNYLQGGKSQIGMATLEAKYFYVKP